MRKTWRPTIPTGLALAALSAVACAADVTPDPGLDVTVLHSRMNQILILLFAAAIGTASVVGFSAGLTQDRGRLQTTALAVFVCGTIHVILDLDRPLSGVQVDQSPLLHLRAQWEQEVSGA
jgi:hypothetical protein